MSTLQEAPANYAETLALLRQLGRHGIDLGLERVRQVAENLGNPQKRYATILVAGTNGKGSTSAFLASILQKAGYRTGLYTSPHLVRETERIRIDGKDISEDAFAQSARRVYEATIALARIAPPGRSVLTAFEFITLMAFDALAVAGTEIAVVEVGLGGRLDATNIVEPLVSVITPIGLDHQQYLGETIQEIAGEKAGILRKGMPAVCATRSPEAREVIAEKAAALEAPLLQAGKDFDFLPLRDRHMHYAGKDRSCRDLAVGLSGMHQLANAATACAVCECLAATKFPVSDEALRAGLRGVVWRGRMETLSTQPLVMIDGAHNTDGARVLRRYLEQYVPFRKIHLIVGQRPDKDAEGFLAILAPIAARITLTQTSDGALKGPGVLAPLARKVHGNVIEEPDIAKVLGQIYWRRSDEELVVITGSLYLVGEAIALLESGEIKGFVPASAEDAAR